MTGTLPESLRSLAPVLATPTGPVISPATRANVAARLGGGASPAFLEALERIQQGA